MFYISTRGESEKEKFSEILIEGLAKDGGLYVPEKWPEVSFDELELFKTFSYNQLAAKIIAKFAPEIPFEEILKLTTKTYKQEIFGNGRKDSDTAKIFPLRKLEEDLFLLELSNGPTLAFKDAAMQLLGNLLTWALERKGETLTILGATSGDTGGAAIHALRGKPRIKVVMLSPAGRMSDFQRAQMYSVLDENILNIAVEGTFDDCQDLVKAVNGDLEFKIKYHLGAVNSINWARVIAQTVYYISAYLQSVRKIGEKVSFSVPSGNFGNAYAGVVAKLIGVPVERIIVATNENDILHQTMQKGIYEPKTAAEKTSSPSMDITKASNFERAIFEANNRNSKATANMMKELSENGKLNFIKDYPDTWNRLKELGLCSSTSKHDSRLRMIQDVYKKWKILIDPHTADGMNGAVSLRRDGEKMIVLETAQAVKFAPTIKEALGFEPDMPKGFENLLTLPQRYKTTAKDIYALKTIISNFSS